MSFTEVLTYFERVRRTGPGRAVARCPAHADRSPSLSITQGRKGILLYCFAGCAIEAILADAGLGWDDLFEDGGARNKRLQLPTPRQQRAAEEHRKREEQRRARLEGLRHEYRDVACCLRVLDQRSESLARAMAKLPEDSPEYAAVAQLMGRTIHLFTAFERTLHGVEAAMD